MWLWQSTFVRRQETNGTPLFALGNTHTHTQVVFASAFDVTAVTPIYFSSGSTPIVTLEGAVATPTTKVAFAPPGGCSTPDRIGDTVYNVAGPVLLDGALNIPGRSANLSVCYSVNNGVTWVEQDGPWIFVTDECGRASTCGGCVDNPLCGWCLSTGFCSISLDVASCPLADHVLAAGPEVCPHLGSIAPESGAAYGGTNVSFALSRFARADGMECLWDFGGATARSDIVVLSDTLGTCAAPPRQLSAPAVALSITLDNKVCVTVVTVCVCVWLWVAVGVIVGDTVCDVCDVCLRVVSLSSVWLLLSGDTWFNQYSTPSLPHLLSTPLLGLCNGLQVLCVLRVRRLWRQLRDLLLGRHGARVRLLPQHPDLPGSIVCVSISLSGLGVGDWLAVSLSDCTCACEWLVLRAGV